MFKLSKTSDDKVLWNDYTMRRLMRRQFGRLNSAEVRVPDCHFFIPADELSDLNVYA